MGDSDIFKAVNATERLIDQTGIDTDDVTNLSQSIAYNIGNFFNKNSPTVGSSFTSLLFNNETSSEKNKSKVNNKTLIKLNDLVNKNGQFSSIINDVFFNESENLSLHNDFQTISALIPEISLITNTYYENIVSPDSINHKNLHVNYTSNDKIESNNIEKQINYLIKETKLEKKISEAIKQWLCSGRSYIGILNFTDAFSMVLKENYYSKDTNDRELFESLLVEGVNSFLTPTKILKESQEEIEFLEDLTESKMDKETIANELSKVGKSMFQFQSFDEFVKDKKSSPTSSYHKSKKSKNQEKELDGDVPIFNDVHVFNIDPTKIVPIKTETDDVLGYFYIEYDLTNSIGKYKSTKSNASTINSIFNGTPDSGSIGNNIDDLVDSKKRIVSEVFTKMIGKKIDSKFISENYQFKDVMYSILKNEENLKKKFKITFLPPECVSELGQQSESVLKNILFVSKMYLSCTMSNFMQRIVQSPEKRIFYVDVGLDDDIPGAVNSFAKSIKSQEFSMDNLGDINSALRSIGTHQDLYIPTQNNEKPIDTEIMPSKEIGYQDDFLDFLKNSMLVGSGIPSAYLGVQEDVDFAKSLSMNNNRFAKTIMQKNNEANEFVDDLLTKILYQKFKYSESNKNKEVDNLLEKIDSDKLFVGFPKPMSLMIQMYSDRTREISEYVDFTAKAMFGEDNIRDNEEADEFKYLVTKQVTPDIDWSSLEEIKEKAKRNIKAKNLKNKGADEEEEDSGSAW